MGRHYLKHSHRYPQRIRHAKRTWSSLGASASEVEAPICRPAYPITGAGNPWVVEVIGPTPPWGTAWAVGVNAKVISTGVAVAPVTTTFTLTAAARTPAEVAAALASAIDAHLAFVCPAPAAGQASFQITLADALNQITGVFVGAVTNAAPVQAMVEATADEDEDDEAPKTKRKNGKKGH
jgi:hypothetical protein